MFITALIACSSIGAPTAPPRHSEPPKTHVLSGVSGTHFAFVENRGQWNSEAKFMARGNGVDVWVTSTGIKYEWRKPGAKPYTVAYDFVGATGKGRPVGDDPQPGVTNYYNGPKRAVGIHSFGRATIKDLYPGIDLVAYFEQERPRYDLVVHPGADPRQIRMRHDGAQNLALKHGAAAYSTPLGSVTERKLLAYQQIGSKRTEFVPKEVWRDHGTVGFDVAGYRRDQTLVIDPLLWSTLLGGETSNNSIATINGGVSSSVTIAQGQTTAPFTVNTSTVTSLQHATITASLGAYTRPAYLTIKP